MKAEWNLITDAAELLATADAKLHLRVDWTTEDTLIAGYVTAARKQVEHATGYLIGSQTWEYHQERWSDELWLPGAPLTSVTSVKYYDTNGTQQTLATTVYRVDTASEPGRIELIDGQSWPSLQAARGLPITIQYVAGHTSSTLPKSLYSAMLLLVGHYYANREAVNVGNIVQEFPLAVKSLVGSHQAPWRPPVAA